MTTAAAASTIASRVKIENASLPRNNVEWAVTTSPISAGGGLKKSRDGSISSPLCPTTSGGGCHWEASAGVAYTSGCVRREDMTALLPRWRILGGQPRAAL